MSEETVVGRDLVWSDEFDRPAGSLPYPGSWSFELGDGAAQGNPGWGNREQQRYTNDPANAAHDGDGNLAITARATGSGYTSARIITKGKVEVRYGRIETRLRVPAGTGLWPAVWALGANIDSVPWPGCGEIDVMEHVGREPHRVFGTIHGLGYAGPDGFSGAVELAGDLADDFHEFAVDWVDRRIEWSIDGRIYHVATPGDLPGPWVFDHRFYLLMNLAVGGDLGGPVGQETSFPQSLLVDYVRVYSP
jgi:beta-glucanase (GH16 family)